MLCSAKNSRVTRSVVASSATAFAPFSQNSAVCRSPGAGSGQAHDMQSNPSVWFIWRSVRTVRRTPIWRTASDSDTATAFGPAACSC